MERPMPTSVPHGIRFHGPDNHMPLHCQTTSHLNQYVTSTYESNQIFVTKTTASQSSLLSDLVAFQKQLTIGVNQLSLSRFIADSKRNQSVLDYLQPFHFQHAKNHFPMCYRRSLSPFAVDVPQLERSQFLSSISSRESFFFLNEQIHVEENCDFGLRNLISTSVKRDQELPSISAYDLARDLCVHNSSANYSLDLSKAGIPLFKINGNVACSPYFPRMKNPAVMWNQPSNEMKNPNLAPVVLCNQPSIEMEKPNLSELRSCGLINAALRVAPNWNDKHYGPVQSSARRSRRRQRNNGPYKCPKCQREFAIPQSMAAHIKSHYWKENETNKMMCSKSKLMNLDNMAASDDCETQVVVKQGSDKNHL